MYHIFYSRVRVHPRRTYVDVYWMSVPPDDNEKSGNLTELTQVVITDHHIITKFCFLVTATPSPITHRPSQITTREKELPSGRQKGRRSAEPGAQGCGRA
jgi:hypothetical protein